MDIETFERFFLWCMVINTIVYLITLIASVLMRGFIYKVHQWLFDLDKETVDKAVLKYLSNFKLFQFKCPADRCPIESIQEHCFKTPEQCPVNPP